MNDKIVIKSLEQTLSLAEAIGNHLTKGMVLALEGDLGAGKTTFTKGLAKGLDIKRNINSPTFTMIKEYIGRLPLYHMDVYRLKGSFDDIGLEEYFYGEGVCVVEWASIVEDLLPQERLEIKIYRQGDTERLMEFTAIGEKYQFIEEVLRDASASH